MPLDEMPLDEMPLDEMPFDEMPLDEMPLDEMPSDKMPLDEMPSDKMPRRRICKVCIVVFMTDFPLLKNGTTKGVGFLSTAGPVLKTVRRRN